jgi:hypothetical protein
MGGLYRQSGNQSYNHHPKAACCAARSEHEPSFDHPEINRLAPKQGIPVVQIPKSVEQAFANVGEDRGRGLGASDNGCAIDIDGRDFCIGAAEIDKECRRFQRN